MWRGVSLRRLAVLVFAPMLTETLATIFLSWMVLQAAKGMGLPPRQVMWIAAGGSMGYALSAFVAGRWVTPRWAPRLMIGSILVVAVAGWGAMAVNTFGAFVLGSVVLGLCYGHYYVPFQINMMHVRPFHTVAWSVGFYNIAWGTGAAVGPYVGSSLRTGSLAGLAGLVGVLAAGHTLLNILALRAPPPHAQAVPIETFHSTPAHRRTGLIAFIAVGFIVRGLYAMLWAELGHHYGWSDREVGLGLLAMFAPVPVASLLWARLRRRLGTPWVMLGCMALGVAAFAGMGMTRDWAVAVACGVCIGVMESCVVFHAIYYMNSDADPVSRGRGVGVFEMCAGLCNIGGPVSLGLLAWDDAASWRPYAFGCSVVGAAVLYIAWEAARLPASSPR